MARPLRLLDQVHVAAPCPANWEEMKGDDQVRHCSQCRRNVYNLSEMTESEAENLLRTHEGRLCIQYYRRADGKVMTKDCPKGLRALRLKVAKRLVLAASFVLTAIGCGEHGEKIKQAYGIDMFVKIPPRPPSPVFTRGEVLLVPPTVTPIKLVKATKKVVPIPTTKGKKTNDPIAGGVGKPDESGRSKRQ
jgi:hypothetical protein